ncbi:hypothetical protein GEMMAAP_05770 [Gemmatimonas phototrophica]|uniref:Uncharacterized protein n=1 Tax=Gemmatimonas phototrophica TaxID=1379270 RepID=A0A143BJ74_9BACT|nr:hypothetical protein GEMMAAP_05770 [Gemmatimonas phototrophica]
MSFVLLHGPARMDGEELGGWQGARCRDERPAGVTDLQLSVPGHERLAMKLEGQDVQGRDDVAENAPQRRVWQAFHAEKFDQALGRDAVLALGRPRAQNRATRRPRIPAVTETHAQGVER